ncbi:disease resistance protein At4g27190-like [Mangifera indica]|uniref:disease resistance protein At4g27190-like n=1 Tax=Mangifera indica TaxID=29780 RepID=UPI001CFB438A|nr:disease resistance protein At4g27190-like [Mangifera indica]
MAGIGKTVLVKQLAARAETEKLFDVVIFAEVTSRSNMKEIQGDIADHLGLMFRWEDDERRAIRLFDRLKKEKNVLMGSQQNFAIGVLDEEEAFGLFKKIAGDSAENQELQPLAIYIAKASGGLPLAISSTAIALRGKGIATWRNALLSLRRPLLNNFSGILAEVYSSIELSYSLLKGEELKSTFLLCSLMKYSGNVSIMELLKYGMGLGLFKEISSVEEARNRVYTLIHELKCCCLLLDGHSDEWFSIHEIVLLVAISIASRDQYAFTVTNGAADCLDKEALRRCQAMSICDSNNRELPEVADIYVADSEEDIAINQVVNKIEFGQIRSLNLKSLPKLRSSCFKVKSFYEDVLEDLVDSNMPLFNETVILPSLEEMVISGMDNLKVIWNYQLLEHSFQRLKIVEIKNFDKLFSIFPSATFERFWQLETLTVTACASLVEIFDLPRLNVQAQLKELYIHGLPKARHIWKTEPQVKLSFPKLRLVKVIGCQDLQNLFPASIAKSLFELEELELVNCGVKEIFSKEESGESTIRFVFPRTTILKFSMLPQLRYFYPGTHTSEWMALKRLEVCDCDNVEIFTSKLLGNQLDVPAKQPLFLVEKVFPNLEELKLGGKVIAMIWQGTFPEHLFRRVEVLLAIRDESDVFPFQAFQRFHNLEKLILSRGSYKELFSHEETDEQDRQAMPSSTSFYNPTVLEVWFCKNLKNLVAPSTAKTLVLLKEMKIGGCEMMVEVVANEGCAIEKV